MAQEGLPFPLPKDIKLRNPGPWRVKPLEGSSDGDVSKWPTTPYRPSDSRNYLIRLAQDWAEQSGIAHQGNFYLEKLPDGYGCFEVDQPGGSQVYKRLFGHPTGRYYDSIVKFKVHFLWLMGNRQGNCECILCGSKVLTKPVPTRPRNRLDTPDDDLLQDRPRPRHIRDHSSSRSDSVGIAHERRRRQAGQRTEPPSVDEEGTEDVWRAGVKLLYRSKNANRPPEQDIEERNSIDWRADQASLPRYMTIIDQQHSFIPRIGELVLWCPNWLNGHHLVKDPEDNCYKFYSFDTATFNGFPAWRGGIVAAAPSADVLNGTIDFPDLLYTPAKKTAANTAAFRIETMPDPNDEMDKSFSKQYKYIHLEAMRPLSHWQLILRGIPQKRLHPSIMNALTCMTSLSLVDKWRLNGEWPYGQIFAKGMHLGSEFITTGDAVRLRTASLQHGSSQAPRSVEEKCTDVLVVETIRLHLLDCKPEHTDPSSELLSSALSISLVGLAFTVDYKRAYDMPTEQERNEAEAITTPQPLNSEEVKAIFRAVGADGYGPWYRMHHPQQRFEVTYDQVLGRLYEADAIRLWSGQRQHVFPEVDPKHTKPDLSYDASSIMSGRRYATQTDERLPEIPVNDASQIRWLISDDRGQALSIATLNGIDLAPYHDIRTSVTLNAWRGHLRILDGQKPDEIMQSLLPRSNGNLLTGDAAIAQMLESEGKYTGKRRGRPPGTNVIDGKLYYKNQLPEGTHKAGEAVTEAGADQITDGEGDDSEDVIDMTKEESKTPPRLPRQVTIKRTMAGAALVSTDEDDLGSEEDDASEDEQFYEAQAGPSIPESQQFAEYDENENYDDEDDDEHDEDPSASTRKTLSKSQIMESTEVPDDEAFDYDSDEDEEEDFNDGWDDPRNARGGTEESSGGDYEPAG